MSDRPARNEAASGVASARAAFFRRHLPLFLLLAVLAVFSFRTVNTYLLSDDLKWIERTVADARRPWNAFGAPLFQDYFRPVPHLAWLVNYWLWGFDFVGHHVMYLGAWLGVVALVYVVGNRMGGRVAGLIAAAIVGFNDVYLLVASWKSWYTTVLELLAVLGWAWFYLNWLERRRRRDLAAWLALAGVAAISRELALLVISACVFVTAVLPAFGREAGSERKFRRGFAWLSVWLVATVAVLALLPSYRHAALALMSSRVEAVPPTSGPPGVSLGYAPDRLRTHTHSMLNFGIARYLILFAILHGLARRFDWRKRLGGRYGPAFLGALAIGVAVLAAAAHAGRDGGGGELRHWTGLVLLAAFVAAELAGRCKERFTAAWFAAAYLPPMVLLHASNAYHMMAFVALALAVGTVAGRYASEDIAPVLRRLLGRGKGAPGEEWRPVTAALVLVLFAGQGALLVRNTRLADPVIRDRIAFGSARRADVEAAVAGTLADSTETQEVWAGRDGYARVAAWMLREEHGFAIRSLPEDRRVVGLRTFDSPLPVYSAAVVYDDALFRKYNAFPNPGFEEAVPGLAVGDRARSGRRALEVRAEADAPHALDQSLDSSPFALRPDTGYVFGGFLMKTGGVCDALRMELRSADGAYRVRTQAHAGRDGEWEPVWACAAPPEGVGKLVFGVIVVEGLSRGAVCADDVFLCPVKPLMEEARAAYGRTELR